MTLADVYALVDRDTKDYRRNDQYELPAGRLRSIIEVAFLAGQAESRSERYDERTRPFAVGEQRGCVRRKSA